MSRLAKLIPARVAPATMYRATVSPARGGSWAIGAGTEGPEPAPDTPRASTIIPTA